MQSRFEKIHMKITNSICKCTTGQNCLLVLYALWVCHFCLNFYRLSMHLNFWYKVHLMMHYGCASFEFFLNIPTMFFHRVFTFPPRRWFALDILPSRKHVIGRTNKFSALVWCHCWYLSAFVWWHWYQSALLWCPCLGRRIINQPAPGLMIFLSPVSFDLCLYNENR